MLSGSVVPEIILKLVYKFFLPVIPYFFTSLFIAQEVIFYSYRYHKKL